MIFGSDLKNVSEGMLSMWILVLLNNLYCLFGLFASLPPAQQPSSPAALDNCKIKSINQVLKLFQNTCFSISDIIIMFVPSHLHPQSIHLDSIIFDFVSFQLFSRLKSVSLHFYYLVYKFCSSKFLLYNFSDARIQIIFILS